MQYNPEITGKIIKSERKKLKLTQEGLGKRIPISGKQISNYERGILFPPDSVLMKLCDLFDCERGYLLGENDYSNKTKLYTEIYNATGISESSIKNILYLTGNSKDSIDFGYNFKEYRKILDLVISSARFCEFIEALFDLDELSSQSPYEELVRDIGEERLRRATELESGPIDYRCDPNAPLLTESEHADLNRLDASIDAEETRQFNLKVAKYSVYEAFERLMADLYPADK